MKKRIAVISIAAALLASVTACGSQPGETPPAAENAATDGDATPPGPADASEQTAPTGTDSSAAPTSEPAQAAQPPAATETEAAQGQDLTADSIGPVSFTPNEKGYSMVYGSNTLHAYFKRLNVIPGSGKMTVRRTADDSVVEEIGLKDTGKCTIAQPDTTFDLLGWNGGTHLVIRLRDTPASGEAYYINLEEGAFTSQDGAIRSKAITDPSVWSFGVAPYGVIPKLPSGSQVLVGDVLSADVLVRQPAVLAKVENYDENRVRFNEKEFVQDAKLEIKIYQIGEDPFTVTFYDDDDNPIGSITLSYTASMPPEPEEEAPKKSITNL